MASGRSSLSRASSTGSLRAGGGSGETDQPTSDGHHPHGSDDEDSDGRSTSLSYKERRREAHTQAEQKRRDAIKKGYDYLQDLVPTCSAGSGGPGGGTGGGAQGGADGGGASNHKVSKATVLQKSIDYIQHVQQQKRRQEEELALLRKEVIALQIMRGNYEQLVKAHQAQPADKEKTFVPSEVKFQTFQILMDKLFVSFNEQVPMTNFSALSGSIFSWLEERCKPQLLQETMYDVLAEVRLSYQSLEEQDQQQQRNRNHHDLLAQMKPDEDMS